MLRKVKIGTVKGSYLESYSNLNERAAGDTKYPLVIVKVYVLDKDHVYFVATKYKRGNAIGEWTYDGRTGISQAYSFIKSDMKIKEIREQEELILRAVSQNKTVSKALGKKK